MTQRPQLGASSISFLKSRPGNAYAAPDAFQHGCGTHGSQLKTDLLLRIRTSICAFDASRHEVSMHASNWNHRLPTTGDRLAAQLQDQVKVASKQVRQMKFNLMASD
jgi:hypothetical protein